MKNKTKSISLTIPENVLSFYRLEADSMQISLSSLISSMLAKKIEGINLDLLNAMGHEYLPEFIALAEAAKGNDGEFDTDIHFDDELFRYTHSRLLAYDETTSAEQERTFQAMHIAGQCWWVFVDDECPMRGFWSGSIEAMEEEYRTWYMDILDLHEQNVIDSGEDRIDKAVEEFNDWAHPSMTSKRYVWVPDNDEDDFDEYGEPNGDWVMTGEEESKSQN